MWVAEKVSNLIEGELKSEQYMAKSMGEEGRGWRTGRLILLLDHVAFHA